MNGDFIKLNFRLLLVSISLWLQNCICISFFSPLVGLYFLLMILVWLSRFHKAIYDLLCMITKMLFVNKGIILSFVQYLTKCMVRLVG